jgi:hypothetical protein
LIRRFFRGFIAPLPRAFYGSATKLSPYSVKFAPAAIAKRRVERKPMTRSIRALPHLLIGLCGLCVSVPAFAQAPTPLPPPPPPPIDAAAPAAAPPAPPPPPAATAPAPGAAAPTTYAPAPMAAPPPPPPPSGGPELSTLRILHEKGVLSDKEYESAVKDLTESTGTKALESNTVVMGKWATTLYGFVEADYGIDSTQSFSDLPGNTLVAYPGSYAGEQGRSQFSIRNSRIGFRMKAPEYSGIRTSAMLEMDFLGTQLPIGTGAGTGSEAAFFNNPTFRVRHMNLKMETSVVDILFGQYWELYGWQGTYHPNTVELQGVPGQLYSRTMQLRLSKTIKSDSFVFEAAVAAMRPPQRNSQTPEGQAGIRFAVPLLSGVYTAGGTGTSIQPLSLAITGDARAVRLPSYTIANEGKPDQATSRMGTAVAFDAIIPVIPAKVRQGNALTLNGEFSTGYGISDLYTQLSGGAPIPQPPATTAGGTAPAQDLDTGIAMYDANGGIHLVQWTSYLMGLQYYFPGLDGKAWISANYSHIESANLKHGFVSDPKKFMVAGDWFDVNLVGDVTPSVRVGIEYANFNDVYGNGWHAVNHHGQMSAWYIF